MVSQSLKQAFAAIVGNDNVMDAEVEKHAYSYDAAVLDPVVPSLVVRPTETEMLGKIVKICNDNGLPLTVRGAGSNLSGAARMMWVSLVTALIIPIGKTTISLLSAFAIVYFRFPFRNTVFWLIFITLMLPVEVRIGPTYEVVASLGMLNTYAGLTIPLIASATATFLFRQFFLTVPDELVEAARIDGAGPMRFFRDVLIPLSATSIAALFVIQFIYGWNQYLWPLLMTTHEDMYPVVMGIKRLLGGEAYTEWNVVMATAILAMLPPALVVILMQKWFVKGLVDTEK